MSVLFELDDFTETTVQWRLVPDWHLCGLCGAKANFNQGGTVTAGAVCDACAQIDRCDERHVSHWGIRHSEDDHDRLVVEQSKRRARFLRAVRS